MSAIKCDCGNSLVSVEAICEECDRPVTASLPVSNTGENADLISSLNAWAPLVEQGLEVPGAGQVMRNAATSLGLIENMRTSYIADNHLIVELKRRIETAETLLEEARKALEPFVAYHDRYFDVGGFLTDEYRIIDQDDDLICTVGDLRRARATLDRIGK